MTSEFDRKFYKASIVQSSLNILSRRGNHEATFCEVLNLIRAEHRKVRFDTHRINLVHQDAIFIRNAELNRMLGKAGNHTLTGKEYRRALKLLEEDMKDKGIAFRSF